MRLLFTRLQEEITTVRKSVTRFGVETGSSDMRGKASPVIELTPVSPQRVDLAGTVSQLNPPPDSRKALPAPIANADQVEDTVDLRGARIKGSLTPVTYSARDIMRTEPYPEEHRNDRLSTSERVDDRDAVSVYHAKDDPVVFSILDEKQARYQFTARKFIATQEMVEYHTAKDRHVSFELTI